MFYIFGQNNSGGSFQVRAPKGIGEFVIVEANSPQEANDKAQKIGLYFDGVADDLDCECCGDRWYKVWDDDPGTKTPEVYGKSHNDYKTGWKIPSYVHYLNGKIEEFGLNKKGNK